MFFKHVYFEPPELLKEKRLKGRRHYVTPEGNLLPSVTTVLSSLSKEGIERWKYGLGKKVADKVRKDCSIIEKVYDNILKHSGEALGSQISTRSTTNGTIFHKMVEDYLNNEPLDDYKKVTPKGLFEQAKPELNKINNVWAQEVQFYSEYIGVAG